MSFQNKTIQNYWNDIDVLSEIDFWKARSKRHSSVNHWFHTFFMSLFFPLNPYFLFQFSRASSLPTVANFRCPTTTTTGFFFCQQSNSLSVHNSISTRLLLFFFSQKHRLNPPIHFYLPLSYVTLTSSSQFSSFFFFIIIISLLQLLIDIPHFSSTYPLSPLSVSFLILLLRR